MIRVQLLALAVLLTSLARAGLASPGPTDETATYAALPATDAERASMQRSLASVVKSLPAPASGFRLAPDGSSEDVGRVVLELGGGKQPWGPVEASAERIYDRTDASDNEDRTLEIRVSINGTKGLSTGLASVGGTPKPFAVAGAFSLEQTLIGVDDAEGGSGSRVALPVDESRADRTVALLRIYIVPKVLEDRLRAMAKGSDALPAFDSSYVPSSKRAVPRSLVIEVHGQKRDVEAYARRVRAADLRRLTQG
ncbi:MAG TPA: hypothetical protein VFT97_03970 [Candidatus Eisenbacteria bacterium]|nr:hypothetical protein [Candidatus Eisenbacteria bacterium]